MYAGVPSATPSDGERAARAPRCVARGERLRDAEVGDHRDAAGEQHVVRLDVAVDDAVLVRVRERARDVAQDAHRLGRRGSSPCRASRARSDSPSTNGIVKYGSPSASPAVSSGTMCGCWSRAASWISRLNRSTRDAAPPARAGAPSPRPCGRARSPRRRTRATSRRRRARARGCRRCPSAV